MDANRGSKYIEYVSYLLEQSGLGYSYSGRYIKAVGRFLEEAEEVNMRGWNRWRKSHAEEVAKDSCISKGILDFLNFIGARKGRKRKEVVTKLEKLETLSAKNVKIVNDFAEWLMSENDYSPHTLNVYLTGVRQFYSYATEFSNENCRRFIETKIADGMNPQTIRLRITALEKLGKFLRVAITLKRPKFQKSLDTNNIPTESEYRRLIDYLRDTNFRHYLYIRILATTGARLSEFLQMRWSDILAGEVTLKGKGNKYRRFFFTKDLQEEVTDFLKGGDRGEYVCMSKTGDRMSSRGLPVLMKGWGKRCNIAKEKMHPHAFRHFFAKMYLKKTNDVIQLADLLGHGSVDTTRIYLRKSYDEQKREFARTITW